MIMCRVGQALRPFRTECRLKLKRVKLKHPTLLFLCNDGHRIYF